MDLSFEPGQLHPDDASDLIVRNDDAVDLRNRSRLHVRRDHGRTERHKCGKKPEMILRIAGVFAILAGLDRPPRSPARSWSNCFRTHPCTPP